MFFRGLKAKIALNIAVLLLVSMLLMVLVIMVTVKRELIRSEVHSANILLTAIEENLINGMSPGGTASGLVSESLITKMINDSQISHALLLGSNGESCYLGETSKTSMDELYGFTHKAISAGEQKIHFIDTSWILFWKLNPRMVVATPLVKNGTTLGGVGIELPLDRVHHTLRRSQQFLLFYIFINLIILTFVGIQRISKPYLQPLARLAKRAADYKEDDALFFSVRKEDNELNSLSRALNSMLKRISNDKEKLRSTVLSLERSNLELKQAQRDIIRAEKLASVGRLSAGIAHEIGNPIGIVMGYLELLRQPDITEDERDEFIQRTADEIERINNIIRQLLEISRPSNSDRKAVSVHNIVQDTADVLHVQPLMSNIELSLDLAAENDTVLAEPNQLRQVFLNLIINAADAISGADGPQNGKMKISTRHRKNGDKAGKTASDLLNIQFSDNGPGIAEENLSNIFDPFFTTKDPGRGTGLGLSVSFMIVESLGGKMTGTSEVGKGTTMIITLPLCKSEQI
jgi:two-component system, NtrC family, sensor kinase